jgi:NAD(P)-dependent dehydrogenase (short-subunit alcohol dehydrogenase family)
LGPDRQIQLRLGAISKIGRATYSATRSGLDGLAAEVAADGVLANCVSPGIVDTELLRGVYTEEQFAKLGRSVPIGRLARPEEIAALVACVAGPENTYISGRATLIDVGFSMV